ncbi:MAG: flavin-dependent oxidoreductase [Rhodobacteraceae bacterium]|nr:MAG: flavin-dependent oxidoreductase [Paracoccaceae bacterium]
MTVLISGAGIGGLTLALSLHQAGIPCRIFEAVTQVKPLGVGINLQPSAVRELAELGLLAELDKIGLRTEEVVYASAQGGQIWSEPRGMKAGYKWPQYSIHRGHLQMLLLKAVRDRLGENAIQTGAEVVDWADTPDGVEIVISDRAGGETRENGSVFVAADGLHSNARARLYPDEGPPIWGGIVMWRGVTKGPKFLTGRSMAMIGEKKRKFVCYPIADTTEGSVINWICDLKFPPEYMWSREDWNRPGVLDDFLPEFKDWSFDWLDVPEIIRTAEHVFEFPMIDRDPLPRWTHGNMTLLGDAAHPMYPIGSNGATQAILDARVLVREMLKQGETAAALQCYDAERRPITAAIVLANRGDGPDKVLDVVAQRAPNGFAQIEDVLSKEELETTAGSYKKTAGMDIDALNNRPSIIPPLNPS